MKALISPLETVVDPATGSTIGQRIAEISETGFEVAQPLLWMDCDTDVVADVFYYDTTTGKIQRVPEAVIVGAQTL